MHKIVNFSRFVELHEVDRIKTTDKYWTNFDRIGKHRSDETSGVDPFDLKKETRTIWCAFTCVLKIYSGEYAQNLLYICICIFIYNNFLLYICICIYAIKYTIIFFVYIHVFVYFSNCSFLTKNGKVIFLHLIYYPDIHVPWFVAMINTFWSFREMFRSKFSFSLAQIYILRQNPHIYVQIPKNIGKNMQ